MGVRDRIILNQKKFLSINHWLVILANFQQHKKQSKKMILNYKIGLNRIVAYNKPREQKKKKQIESASYGIQSNLNFEEKEEKKQFSFSRRSIGRLKTRLQWFVRQARFKTIYSKKNKNRYSYKLSMITLTLASYQKETDTKNKNYLLNHFLTTMRRSHKLKNYIWRAEKQKNGNIHYHIIVDRFYHYSIIRAIWNNVLSKAGYIDDYYKKHGKKNPNSIDVHALKNIKNVEAYLIKYMSKDENGKNEIEGRNWTCSSSIVQNCKDITLTEKDELTDVIEYAVSKCTEDKIIKDDYFCIYLIKIEEIFKICKEFQYYFSNYLNQMRYKLN